MPKVPREFMRVMEEHRKLLQKVLGAQAAASMQSVYNGAHQALLSRMHRALAQIGGSSSFSVHQMRMVLVQLRDGEAQIARQLATHLGPISKNAQEVSLRALIGNVRRLNKTFTGSELVLPVEEAARFSGVIDARQSSMLKMHERSMAKYGATIVKKVEGNLAISMLSGQTPSQAIDQVANVIGGEWWQGERIVRTETAFAFNASHYDGIKSSAEEIPELEQRWDEFCDDDGRPLDSRVAVDSIAMHGQVAPAGGFFTMPATAPHADATGTTAVPDRLVGLSWAFPPNRPNDRATLSPWMKDWKIPGWRYQNGKRVPL